MPLDRASTAPTTERPASATGLQLRTRHGRLQVTSADRQVELDPVAADVWAMPADDRPPWRPHAGSHRVSLGAVRDQTGGDVDHVLLNGLPYRRVLPIG